MQNSELLLIRYMEDHPESTPSNDSQLCLLIIDFIMATPETRESLKQHLADADFRSDEGAPLFSVGNIAKFLEVDPSEVIEKINELSNEGFSGLFPIGDAHRIQ